MLITSFALAAATLLCTLVAGFLFAFAVVVMPGIRALEDGAYIRAFQVMDRIIQNNHPLFMLVWVGSVVAILAAAGLSIAYMEGPARLLIVAAAVAYIGGVQLPTGAINVPLNNTLQKLRVEDMDDGARRTEREAFESRWVRSNTARTVIAIGVAAALIAALAMT